MTERDRGIRDPETWDEDLAGLLGRLRDDTPAPGHLKQRIMARIRAEPAPRWRSLVSWFLSPRPIRVSPAMGLGLAAAATVLLLALPSGPDSPVAQGDTAADVQVVTRFVFVAPQASSVHLTGEFLEWSEDGVPMVDPRGTGVWTVDLPLDPGVYQYSFVVDGREWIPDPLAVSQVDDGFGRQNSVVIVTRET